MFLSDFLEREGGRDEKEEEDSESVVFDAFASLPLGPTLPLIVANEMEEGSRIVIGSDTVGC